MAWCSCIRCVGIVGRERLVALGEYSIVVASSGIADEGVTREWEGSAKKRSQRGLYGAEGESGRYLGRSKTVRVHLLAWQARYR